MLDSIIKLVQGPVAEVITKSKEIPAEKKELAVNSTTSAVVNTLQEHITPENISQLTNLFSGNSNALSKGNFLVNGIESSIVSTLSNKIGISATTASGIASIIIPSLMNLLSNKVSGNNGGIDIESLVGMFAGSSKSSSTKGNLASNVMGALGKLFTK